MTIKRMVATLVAVGVGCVASSAGAIPAFARKYGTSCQTCHTVYPKLTPFGEAFRRNGYRFPGVDSDFVKQPTVALGQDAYKKTFPNSVWPGTLPGAAPFALGFNGQAVMHPSKSAGGAQADGGTRFTMQDLIEEGHLWAGGSFDDARTFFGEITMSKDGVDVEHALVVFADLIGPQHAANLVVGKHNPTLSSFGQHSSYVGDFGITPLSMNGLYGATGDVWNVTGQYAGIEVNGVIHGRFDYSVGLNAGASVDTKNTADVFAHVGYKFCGMALDGEGDETASAKPWAENAVTIDAFAYRARTHFTNGATPPATQDDTILTFGGGVRAQFQSLEFDTGIYQERHDHALATGEKGTGLVQYNELSYVVFPWLVPALRIEYMRVNPSTAGAAVSEIIIKPGVAALVRPNLKLTLVGQIERASGAPSADWSAAGGMAAPSAPDATVSPEVEAITLGLAFAF